MRSFTCLLLLSSCATVTANAPAPVLPAKAPAPAAAPSVPTLERLEARVGLSEPELEKAVRARLPDLARCVAFAIRTGGAVVPVRAPERLDDRVKVTLEKNYRIDADEGPFRVKVEAMLSDPECVKAAVSAWAWPREQVEALQGLKTADGPEITILYRFRPDPDASARLKAENQHNFDVFCAAMKGATPSEDLQVRFKGVLPELTGRVKSTLSALFEAVQHAAPVDRTVILAGATREVAQELDLAGSCRAFRGWIPLTTAELLATEQMPQTSCEQRVSDLKALAAKGFGLLAPPISSPRAKTMDEPGLILDFHDPATPLNATPAVVKRLAAEQAGVQKRKRPLAYVVFDQRTEVGDAVFAALQWSVGFELRMLVAREGVPAKYAPTAWPEVVAALEQERELQHFSDAAAVTDVGFWLQSEDQYCPGVADLGKAVSMSRSAAQLLILTQGLAELLEKCGCPRRYAELSWARTALALDAVVDRAGWIPLNIVTTKGARVVELKQFAPVEKLVNALSDVPMQVRLTAGYF